MAPHRAPTRHVGPLLLPVLLMVALAAAQCSAAANASTTAAAAAAPGPPKLDLAKWNQAYKITIANVTEKDLNE